MPFALFWVCRLLQKIDSKFIPIYCESILFRGAEISSFEDDGHIRGYLTSWIALSTKLKKYKNITFNFWQMRNWDLTLKQGQLRN